MWWSVLFCNVRLVNSVRLRADPVCRPSTTITAERAEIAEPVSAECPPLSGLASEYGRPGGSVDPTLKSNVWNQFGAAIDMLENAIDACPDALWRDRSRRPEFWYVAFHSLFFLDLYLSGSVEGFTPPAPFTRDELDPAGVLPERPYTKEQLRAYLQHGRRKCRSTIAALTAERAGARCRFDWGEFSMLELLLYNMRHLQHHTAQLNLILRQVTDAAPTWVTKAQSDL